MLPLFLAVALSQAPTRDSVLTCTCKIPAPTSVTFAHKPQSVTRGDRPPVDSVRGTDRLPLVVRIADSGDAVAKQKQELRELRHETNESGLAKSTIWLAVVTTLLAIATFGLWRGAVISNRQALRAYVGFSFRWIAAGSDFNMILERPHGVNRTAVFVSNHGQTPANRVRFKGECRLLKDPEAERSIGLFLDSADWPLPNGAWKQCDPRGGEAFPLFYEVKGKEQYRNPDTENGERIYAFGCVEYTDIFRRPQSARFCVYHDPQHQADTGGPWVSAPFHNSAT